MKISTINLRVLAAASAFASKEETRYYLNGVCIEFEARASTYVATDGHRLIAYRDDLRGDQDNELLGTFIIPTPQCKPFKLSKDDDGTAKIFGEDGTRLTMAHNFVDVTFAPIDGTFPDWRKVPPSGPASGEIAQFNLEYLASFRKFAKALGLSDVPFVAANGDKPAFVWFTPADHVMGIVMPVRSSDSLARKPPIWSRSAQQQAA